jgi:hypothetical protein
MIRTGACAGPPIEVDRPGVRVAPSDTIVFKNQLNINGNKPDAILKFYKLGEKPMDAGDPDNPIDEFCSGIAGTEVPVPNTGPGITCNPSTHGDYAYSITADDHDDLDPVLIIEESLDFEIGPPTISLPVFGIGLLIAIVLGYLAGKYMR